MAAASGPAPLAISAAPGAPGTTRAAVYSRLERDGGGSCANPGTVLAVGSFADEEKPETAAHGDLVKGSPLSIACKIAPNGPGFLVEAKIGVPSMGELTLSSAVDGEGRAAAANVSLNTPEEGLWTSNMCSLEPSMLKAGGIAPGRYAAAFKCVEAVNRKAGGSPMAGTVFLQGCADH